MSKVYLVTSGSYSDYSVVGVFSSRENAVEFMSRVGEGDYNNWNDVDEMDLDATLPQIRAGLTPWFVEMHRDGKTDRIERKELSDYGSTSEGAGIWRRSQAPAFRGQGLDDLLHANVFASSAEHAVKIANEYRTQMIANGEW